MPGLDPGIHLLRKTMDCRIERASTPVFDGLSPAMTLENFAAIAA
jgi:hypothetical protein